jgi:AcrR family transcriptional regulator
LNKRSFILDSNPEQKPYLKAETREHILDTAYSCIEMQGYENVSIALIGREAGLSRTTLYRYYKDLETLVLNAVRDDAEAISNEIAASIEALDTSEEQLIECIVLTVSGFNKYKWVRLDGHLDVFKDKRFGHSFFNEMIKTVTTPIFKRRPDLKDHPVDVTDFLVRMSISFIYYPSYLGNSDESLRTYLKPIISPVFSETE